MVQGVLNGFVWFVQQTGLCSATPRNEEWCRGWDTNPRTHTGPDLKPGAFDHLSHPCFAIGGTAQALEDISRIVSRPTTINGQHLSGKCRVGQEKMNTGRDIFTTT